MRLIAILIITTSALAACGVVEKNNGPSGTNNNTTNNVDQDCPHGEPGEGFALGRVFFEESRWFSEYEGCREVEIISGFQGGWHIEPGLRAPLEAPRADLGGTMSFEVRSGGEVITMDATYEMQPGFWQDLEQGFVYWGDIVAFNDYPDDLIGETVTVSVLLDFAEDSQYEDMTVESEIVLIETEDETEGARTLMLEAH